MHISSEAEVAAELCCWYAACNDHDLCASVQQEGEKLFVTGRTCLVAQLQQKGLKKVTCFFEPNIRMLDQSLFTATPLLMRAGMLPTLCPSDPYL